MIKTWINMSGRKEEWEKREDRSEAMREICQRSERGVVAASCLSLFGFLCPCTGATYINKGVTRAPCAQIRSTIQSFRDDSSRLAGHTAWPQYRQMPSLFIGCWSNWREWAGRFQHRERKLRGVSYLSAYLRGFTCHQIAALSQKDKQTRDWWSSPIYRRHSAFRSCTL